LRSSTVIRRLKMEGRSWVWVIVVRVSSVVGAGRIP
jgi:hypothetical protein